MSAKVATPSLSARQQLEREEDGRDAERDVHPEQQAPAVLGPAELDEEPADRGAERGGDADDRAEQAERARPLLPLEELLDEAEHLRHLDPGCHALEDPRHHERPHVGRDGAERAREREGAEADHEHEPAAADVAEPARGHEREAERERVARDDELQVGGSRAERLLDRRQADVDLREVEDREGGDADADPEGLPARAVLVGGRGRARGGASGHAVSNPIHGLCIPAPASGGDLPPTSLLLIRGKGVGVPMLNSEPTATAGSGGRGPRS
jgi:hypothetical protein